jgi:hypothetical protein
LFSGCADARDCLHSTGLTINTTSRKKMRIAAKTILAALGSLLLVQSAIAQDGQVPNGPNEQMAAQPDQSDHESDGVRATPTASVSIHPREAKPEESRRVRQHKTVKPWRTKST